MASKAVAAAQGPLHAIRGTARPRRCSRTRRPSIHNEFEEIATYTGIEALAETVNDKETVKLARGIRREEERMAKFLEKQIAAAGEGGCQGGDPGRRVACRRFAVELPALVIEQLAQLLERLQPLVERVAQLGLAAQAARGPSSASSRARELGLRRVPLGFVEPVDQGQLGLVLESLQRVAVRIG